MEDVMKELLMLCCFPEVYHLIKTIPVTSATAKRSFSVLKKVKTCHHGARKTDSPYAPQTH